MAEKKEKKRKKNERRQSHKASPTGIANKEYTVRMHCFGLLGWGDITGKILNLNFS